MTHEQEIAKEEASRAYHQKQIEELHYKKVEDAERALEAARHAEEEARRAREAGSRR